MEVGVRLDQGGVEPTTALGDHGVEGGEVPVGDRLVDQGPQALGGLQLRAVRGQEHQGDPVGHGQALRPVPAGVVEHEDDVARAPGADLAREAGEQRLEEPLAQPGREIPDRLAAGRLDEGGDVQPLVAVMAEGALART